VDEKFFDLHFDANVKGLFFTVQKGLPFLNDGGSIILNGSIAAIKGFPAISVYSATKAAVRSFARTWTNELRERRIRVTVISPGHIDTPIFESWQQGDALVKMKEDLAKTVPLGRMGDPDEIAKAVSFLASDEASHISGIELFVDGGVAKHGRHSKQNSMPSAPNSSRRFHPRSATRWRAPIWNWLFPAWHSVR
jgi:NAD(P)-dependent dehydrogenase (short-subunit alcohol dehydrogenase family)